MQGTINSYSDNNWYYTKLEYTITPLELQNKCNVYMKVSIVSIIGDSSLQGINEQFCKLNTTGVNCNSFTDNTIYPSFDDIDEPISSSSPYSTRYIHNSKTVVYVRFYSQNQICKIYEGTTQLDYNSDGTLTIAFNDMDTLLDGTPTLSISVPVENASNGNVKINGTWKKCWVWHKINGAWKRCLIWKKINGTWKKGE